MKWWASVLLGVYGVACAKVVPPPVSAPPKPRVSELAQPDLSERGSFGDAALPSGPAVWCHIPAPAADLPVLALLTNLGPMLDPEELLARKLGKLGTEVDLKRPVDLVASAGEGDNWTPVLALGVKDLAGLAARTQPDFDLVHVDAGRWRLVPKRELDLELRCEIWQAAAPVGTRMICGEAGGAIEQAGHFLMNAARMTTKQSSLHLEIPAGTLAYLMKKGEQEKQKANGDESVPKNASELAGEQLGRDLVLQFVDAVGGVSWDVTLHESFVDVAQELRFNQSESLFALAVSGRAAHPTVPDAFWRLPTDSDLAFYSEGADKEPLRKAWTALVPRAVEGVKLESVATPAQSSEIEETLESTLFRGGAWEVAVGHDLRRSADALDAAAKELGSNAPKGAKLEAELGRVNDQLGGWLVLGVEDDAPALLASLRRGLSVVNRALPRRKGAKPHIQSPSEEKAGEAPLKSPGALPPGAVHFVLQTRPNKKYVPPKDGSRPAPPPSLLHVIAVPDGGQLWLAAAHDEASASDRLHALLASTPNKALGADTDLRALAGAPLSGLGYVTIGSFVGLSLSANSKQELLASRRRVSNLSVSPSKGETHIPVWVTATGGGATPRRVSFNARLQPGTIGDLLQLAIGGIAGGQ